MSKKPRGTSLFSRFSILWTRLFATSVFSRTLSFYDRANAAFREGLLRRTARLFGAKPRLRLQAKTRTATLLESSAVLSLYRRAVRALLSTRLKSVGVFLFFLGFSNCLIYLGQRFLLAAVAADVAHLFFGLGMVLASLPFFSRRETISSALLKSRISGGFLLRIAQVRPAEIPTASAHTADASAIVLALVCALFCMLFDPLRLLGALLSLAALLLSFYKPELALTLTLAAYPFLSSAQLALMSALGALCLLGKVLRGRRCLRFCLLDSLVLLFSLYVLFSAIFSPLSTTQNAFLLCAILLLYFTATNLCRRLQTAYLFCGAFFAGVCLCSALHLTRALLPERLLLTPVVSLLETLTQNHSAILCVLALPFCLYFAMHAGRARTRLLCVLCALLLCADLWVFSSVSAYLCALCAVLLLLLFSSRAMFFALVLCGICVLIALPLIEGQQTAFLFDLLARRSPSLLVENSGLPASAFLFGLGAFSPAALTELSLAENLVGNAALFSQLLLALGLVGMLLFLCILLFGAQKGLCYFLHNTHSRHRLFVLMPLCSMFALLVFSLAQNPLNDPKLFGLFFLFAALSHASTDLLHAQDAVIEARF